MDNKQEDISLTQIPFGQYEYVDVSFAAADTDTLIPTTLKVENPKFVRWLDVTPNVGAFVRIYRATGSEVVENNLKLRCNIANYATRLLLFVERSIGQNLSEGTVSAPNITAPLPSQVSDDAYASGWNGTTTIAPSKNAVYDKIESVLAGPVFTGLVDISAGTAGQIKFPAAQNSSSDANTLDDYEEGSWTPTIGGDGGESGQTYAVQVGRYTKIGNLVAAQFKIELSALGTITGSVQVKGLPFTSANITNVVHGVALGRWFSFTTALDSLALSLAPNATAMYLWISTAAATSLGVAVQGDLSAGTNIEGTVVYRTA